MASLRPPQPWARPNRSPRTGDCRSADERATPPRQSPPRRAKPERGGDGLWPSHAAKAVAAPGRQAEGGLARGRDRGPPDQAGRESNLAARGAACGPWWPPRSARNRQHSPDRGGRHQAVGGWERPEAGEARGADACGRPGPRKRASGQDARARGFSSDRFRFAGPGRQRQRKGRIATSAHDPIASRERPGRKMEFKAADQYKKKKLRRLAAVNTSGSQGDIHRRKRTAAAGSESQQQQILAKNRQ